MSLAHSSVCGWNAVVCVTRFKITLENDLVQKWTTWLTSLQRAVEKFKSKLNLVPKALPRRSQPRVIQHSLTLKSCRKGTKFMGRKVSLCLWNKHDLVSYAETHQAKVSQRPKTSLGYSVVSAKSETIRVVSVGQFVSTQVSGSHQVETDFHSSIAAPASVQTATFASDRSC